MIAFTGGSRAGLSRSHHGTSARAAADDDDDEGERGRAQVSGQFKTN